MTRWSLALATAIALFVVSGCRDVQSILLPHGPGAAQIATLAWVLFGVGTIVLAVVIITLGLAMRGTPRMRSRLAGERAVIIGGVVFPALTLTGLLAYGTSLMRVGGHAAGENSIARIEVIGEQWWWRVAYEAANGEALASANEIRVPVGRAVEFTLKSADVIHSFWVPSLGGKVDMIPGRTTRLRLRADRPGIFRGQCAEYCGGAHALMALEVVAMPQAEFASWLSREAAPGREPATEEERRGKSVLLAAGCGACHAVRGTQASGSIGPDLTHVAGRRTVGLDTLAMSRANLKQFIAEGQRLKPGNAMPQFRFLPPGDLDALAGYLASLR
jgi:cytochrome c oxidase subunit 2